jgi:hypothetical protein
MKNKPLNTILSGTLLGIILPSFFLILILLARKDARSMAEFFKVVYDIGVLPKIISICLIPNLLLFFIFIWSNRLKSARGVILAMFLAGLLIGLLKII